MVYLGCALLATLSIMIAGCHADLSWPQEATLISLPLLKTDYIKETGYNHASFGDGGVSRYRRLSNPGTVV